jgi:hypothetical protein
VTQESIRVHNLLSLHHLLARHTKGKNPLINYFQLDFVTSSKYFNILRRKTMEKSIVEEIRAGKRKEKGDR